MLSGRCRITGYVKPSIEAPLTNALNRIIYAPMIKNALHNCSYFWLYL